MDIRLREPNDVATCVELMRRTHLATGYPVGWPEDPEAFLVSQTEMIAWVARDDDGEITGHVALHDAEGDAAFGPVHELTGKPADAYSVVARLLVSPTAQGQGIGRALLGVAADVAKGTGRHAILDVVTTSLAAVAFYDALGWHRIGLVEFKLEAHPGLQGWVFAAPGLDDH